MAEVTLTAKNQITLPREAREALNVKPGDKLVVVVRGPGVLLLQKAERPNDAIRGLGKGIYTEDYLDRERNDWG